MNATTPAMTVRAATHDDIPQAATLLTEAFLIAPVSQWLVGDIDARVTTFRSLFIIELEHAIDTGADVYVAGPFTGVAIWYQRDQPESANHITVHQRRLMLAAGIWQHRVAALHGVLSGHRPDRPHRYLAYLGVTPWLQGRGVGTALLTHQHRQLDASATPAYLEATTPRNRGLYLRHGYVADEPVQLPDGPPIWPMWRAPAQGDQPPGDRDGDQPPGHDGDQSRDQRPGPG
ncbi:acetyltransferase (GNAT) family protein [Micromonospora sp. Llam0]|uniref:GNAT family N-acetyltransferase n=1 Tax=Micromonospora sp. Llam0 TaxID=2485143 RepID=UPI000F490E02|nr:GNAT family N-acetyltransferase [Micromonospora sp. Llam0]ROO50751.1 acetyltransferase (GNAT) family protein [Micromonospora sp. Llam0]